VACARLCDSVAEPSHHKKMKIGDLKIYFKDGELIFLDKNDKFLFSLGFSGDIERLQGVLGNDLKKIRLSFSLIPFGIGIWDLSRNEKVGVILIRPWR